MFFRKEKQKKEISPFKAAKRALITSIVSLVVCFAMLSGSTFAWFTDSVTSGKNKIEAGYTDIEVRKYVAGPTSEDHYTGMVVPNSTKVFPSDEWNPGDVRAAYYKVKNTGNLDIILNVDLIARAIENQQTGTTVGDLSDYMVLKAIISKTDFETKDITTEDHKNALKEEAGFNVGTKTFKTDLFPAETTNGEQTVIAPNASAYVKVIAYLPNFDETDEPKPLIFSDKYNSQVSGAKCNFSMTVNAFQVIEDAAITYKTYLWVDSTNAENKFALKQVPAGGVKVWKKVNSTDATVYAFDQESFKAALQSNSQNVVLLNDIFVTDWTTINSFTGIIKSYQNNNNNNTFTVWGLNNRMFDTFDGTIENVVFKNCNALNPFIETIKEGPIGEKTTKNYIYNGVIAAKTGSNADIKKVDVMYSTIANTKQDITPEESYVGALIGWMDKDAKIDNCTATTIAPNGLQVVGYQEPKLAAE